MQVVNFIKAVPGAKMPTRGTERSAGYDLYASEDFIVEKGRSVIPTGIKIALPPKTYGAIRPRSGFSSKGFEGVNLVTGITERFDCDVKEGTVDEDYRGTVGVIVKNDDVRFLCKAGTRIAQIVITPYVSAEWIETKSLSKTGRGDGGFEHTGTK